MHTRHTHSSTLRAEMAAHLDQIAAAVRNLNSTTATLEGVKLFWQALSLMVGWGHGFLKGAWETPLRRSGTTRASPSSCARTAPLSHEAAPCVSPP